MVTIAEAQAQVSSAKKELEQAKTSAQKRQAEIKLAKAQSIQRRQRQARIGKVETQVGLARQVGRGRVRGEISRRRRIARQEFAQTGRLITGAEQELVGFRGQLVGREAEIAGVETQIASAKEQRRIQAQRLSDFEAARKLVRKGLVDPGASPQVKRFIREIRAQQEIGVIKFERESAAIPTQTEIELQMSLPTELRELPASDIIARQTLAPSPQRIPPSFVFEPREVRQLGGVVLSRKELEELRQQSLPLGTTGIIPQEQIIGATFRESFFRQIPPVVAVERGISRAGTFVSEQAPTVGRALTLPGIADIVSPIREERIELRRQAITLGTVGLGLGLRGVATLIPTTPFEIGVTGALVAGTFFAPPVVAGVVSAGVTSIGITGALDPRLTIEERIGSGIIGGLGAVGIAATATPFLRGITARPITRAPEGFEVIPAVEGVGDIGLILPKRGATTFVDLPKTSPLVRGGFGVRPGEKGQFLGRDQILATSQRGLFQEGIDIPIQREFFVTPQEPTLGIAETRISRLGLTEFFKFPERPQIGFGLPPQPQIGITIGDVARTETRGAFAIGTGTELEAIRTTGLITNVRRLGTFRIRAQGVDVFGFETGAVTGTGLRAPTPRQFATTRPTTRVSAESLIGTLGVVRTRGISLPTRGLVSLTSGVFGRTRDLTTRDLFGTTGITFDFFRTPPPSPPPKTPKSPDFPGVSIPTLPPFNFGFKDFFGEPPIKRRGIAERKPKKRKPRKRPGFDIRLAPSFTAIVQDLRGAFPKQLAIGGISPREIRVIPNRRKRKKK